jgi:hypothetical protein
MRRPDRMPMLAANDNVPYPGHIAARWPKDVLNMRLFHRPGDPAAAPANLRLRPRTLPIVGLAALILVGLSSAFLLGLAAVGLLAVAVGVFELVRRHLHRQGRWTGERVTG